MNTAHVMWVEQEALEKELWQKGKEADELYKQICSYVVRGQPVEGKLDAGEKRYHVVRHELCLLDNDLCRGREEFLLKVYKKT